MDYLEKNNDDYNKDYPGIIKCDFTYFVCKYIYQPKSLYKLCLDFVKKNKISGNVLPNTIVNDLLNL